MGRRGRLLLLGSGALVLLLFVGRRSVLILSDIWWGQQMGSGAAAFLRDWHLLRLLLDAGGILLASSWFVGNLVIVLRSLAGVEVPRYLANIEFKEAVTPNAILAVTVSVGLALGILAGVGASEWWPTMALAWHGADFSFQDPVLGLNLGYYLAALPLWLTLRSFAWLLLFTGFVAVLISYGAIGALRVVKGRLAITDHARAHVGALLALVALTLAWGFALHPRLVVAGLAGSVTAGSWSVLLPGSRILTGTALMAGAVSLLWAFRPRHTLALAGWLVLAAAAFTVRVVLPAASADDRPLADPEVVTLLEGMAYQLEGLERETLSGPAAWPPDPAPASPWTASMVRQLFMVDSSSVLSSGPARAAALSGRPVWLGLTESPSGSLSLSAIAGDRVSATGGAVSYRMGDTTAFPSVITLDTLVPGAVRPGAPRYLIHSGEDGMPVDRLVRKLVLAWGLQVGGLLGELPPDAAISWRLDPLERLARLAPFAAWRDLNPVIVDDRVAWLAHGYLAARTFPLVRRARWDRDDVGSLRADFLALVGTGPDLPRIYLAPDAGPLARAWSELASQIVAPPSSMPGELLEPRVYPRELFSIQRQLIKGPESARWLTDLGAEPVEQGVALAWSRDGAPELVAALHDPSARLVVGLLRATMTDGINRLTLTLADSAAAVPTPAVLRQRWGRFPLFEQLTDSIRSSGARLVHGRILYQRLAGGLAAASPAYSIREGARPQLVWLSLAVGDDLGAGRNFTEAWENLIGATAPVPPGTTPVTGLAAEARIWMRRADSALRVGDWLAFGEAFQALRDLLLQP